MEFIFIIAISAILYSYAIYPLILYLINSASRDTGKVSDINEDHQLNVAVIIAAYNEQSHIKKRIENLLALDYPRDKITFYIGSDGSEDDTNHIVSNFNNKQIKFYPFEQRRGKASVLNDLVGLAKEEVIVFSDANTDFKNDAIKQLVGGLSNHLVGGVCGELKILSQEGNDNLDSLYWRYERFIKVNEGKFGAILGANGAIYAIRKNLFQPIPADTITDDFYIGMMIVKLGYQFLYQPNAIAYEYEPDSHIDEFRRRVRIGMGNFQAFTRLLGFLNPLNNWRYFFTYFSHKVLRWVTPHLMVIMFIVSLMLIKEPLFQLVLVAQLIIYSFCWLAYKYMPIKKLPRILSLIVFFVSMNTALFIGFVKYLTQKANPAWQRTSR